MASTAGNYGRDWLLSEEDEEEEEDDDLMAAFGNVAEIEVEATPPFIVLQLSNANWVKKLSQAISNGNTVIMEENCPVDIDATATPFSNVQFTKRVAPVTLVSEEKKSNMTRISVSFYKRSCKTPTINQKYSRVAH